MPASGGAAEVWRKSSRSGATGSCVQVCALDGAVLVRDSKDPEGAVLRFMPAAWADFLAGVAEGDFDRPGTEARPGTHAEARHRRTGGGPLEANL